MRFSDFLILFCLFTCWQLGDLRAVEEGGVLEDRLVTQLVEVDGLEVTELIALLGHANELTRMRAHQQLLGYLVVDTAVPEYAERLTRFHKHAPHACKLGHEGQTLHILGIFAELEDVSSVLVRQCLASPHAQVRATALEVAHFSDNRVDELLLEFEPDGETLGSYRVALGRLGTPAAARRLVELGGD